VAVFSTLGPTVIDQAGGKQNVADLNTRISSNAMGTSKKVLSETAKEDEPNALRVAALLRRWNEENLGDADPDELAAEINLYRHAKPGK